MSANSPDPEVLASFLDEAGQCVATLNDKLLLAESGDISSDVIGEMFRAAHSMKGSAGFLNLTDVASLTHSLETVLDWVRKGKLDFSAEVVDSLFTAFDMVSALLADIAAGKIGEVDIAPTVALLEGVLGQDEPKESAPGEPEAEIGSLPEWLKGHLTIDDVLESLIARNSGQKLWAVLIDLRRVFSSRKDPVAVYHQIEESVHIQSVVPVMDKTATPWQPLQELSYKVGIFCFCKGSVVDALAGCDSLAGYAWEITEGQLAEPVNIVQQKKVDVGMPVETLEIRKGMEKHRGMWVSETSDELAALDTVVLAYEQEPRNREHLNEMFRLMHRLKSSCASMGFSEMSRVAHNCESLLSRYREDLVDPGEEAFSAFFAVKDFLNECLRRVEAGQTESPEAKVIDEALFALLQKGEVMEQVAEPVMDWKLEEAQEKQADEAVAAGKGVWKVHVTLREDTALPDIRYAMILRELADTADLLYAKPSVENYEEGMEIPPPFYALLAGADDEEALRKVLQFDLIDSFVIEQYKPEATAAAVPSSAAGRKSAVVKSAASVDTVRVDTSRLDQMMNVAGELVITKARITQLSERINHYLDSLDVRGFESLIGFAKQASQNVGSETRISGDRIRRFEHMVEGLKQAQEEAVLLRDTTLELHRHTSSIQNGVMQIRMVPIGPLFQRFHRLVRDLCKEKDRNARLVNVGESTELDKKLIDELTDPLTHLIRNSVDHGLESPSERVKVGKSEQGTVMLEAFHEGGQICIRVSDDGRGLDAAKIRAKAVKNGLLGEDAAERLPLEEVYQLIFQPGFSTAAQITNISGRGVGMDIVKSKVNELKGSIDIDSRKGKGASFTIRLPLTLAMIEGLLTDVGGTRYAFPLESVREIVEITDADIKTVEGKGKVIFLRNEAIALVELDNVIDADPRRRDKEYFRAVITKGSGETLAVAVDKVLGDEEVVVKALSEEFASVCGISGATVLGDGGIALILDVGAVCELARSGGKGRREIFAEEEG